MNRRDALRSLIGAATFPSLGLLEGRGADTVERPVPAALSRIQVHPSGHLLQTEDGRPFFWLGDTAWQLVHGTSRSECSYYLHTRALQGFTVIQTVILSEFDGLNHPSEFGERPLYDDDPGRPNPAYFRRVVEIVDEAAREGLYVALVPVWGDKLTAPWGVGPRIFTTQNTPAAAGFGRYLGALLKDRGNVVWLLGGDRPAKLPGLRNDYLSKMAAEAGFPPDQDWSPVWRALAEGLGEGLGRPPLTIFHPQGGPDSSSVLLPGARWLGVNGMQSGHGGGHDVPVWDWIARDFAQVPAKPTLDLEPNYEDHPFNPWPRWDPATGYFRDHDVRKQTYRSVFAGGCGVTYGHHAVWQFAGPGREVINHADRDWADALWRPAGRQMRFLRALVESRPFFTRIPDPGFIVGDPGSGGNHAQACRDSAGSYAFVYFPGCDLTLTLDATRLRAARVRAWWYDPRTGVGSPAGVMAGGGQLSMKSPAYGPDWVLVLDDAQAPFAPPGLPPGTGPAVPS